MRDFVKILESNKKANFQKTVTMRGEGQPKLQWNALNLIEEASEKMQLRLNDILDDHLEIKVPNVKLDIFNELGTEPQLMVKAQLYASNSREIMLKVFVHEIHGKGKTRKLAKAIYNLELVNVLSGKKVA